MSTTSLKLPADLKQRAIAAASKQGVTPHAFMLNAIAQAATAAEHRADFVAQAGAARKLMLDSGKGYDAEAVHTYLRNRASGKKSTRPKAGSWRG